MFLQILPGDRHAWPFGDSFGQTIMSFLVLFSCTNDSQDLFNSRTIFNAMLLTDAFCFLSLLYPLLLQKLSVYTSYSHILQFKFFFFFACFVLEEWNLVSVNIQILQSPFKLWYKKCHLLQDMSLKCIYFLLCNNHIASMFCPK